MRTTSALQGAGDQSTVYSYATAENRERHLASLRGEYLGRHHLCAGREGIPVSGLGERRRTPQRIKYLHDLLTQRLIACIYITKPHLTREKYHNKEEGCDHRHRRHPPQSLSSGELTHTQSFCAHGRHTAGGVGNLRGHP